MTARVPVIGLEVHCRLRTRTKLFCGCAYRFGAPPNTLTCPVCSGQPGALPVLNEEALRLAVRVALALGADVAPVSKFDRKNYFYCDLPKGYQTTQYDEPFSTGGGIELASGKRVRLARIHLEEDAGKAIHDRGSGTLVDLNRAGTPLIESVTEPDLASADEAVEYLARFKELVEYTGASDGDMEKGSLRCDVNVSLHRPGEPLGTKVELKNLNSFRHVQDAIEHEIARQGAALDSGDPERHPVQETRLWDEARGETRPMRGKEDAHDYRYFPDPDLPPVAVDADYVAARAAELCELPEARRRRYVAELGLELDDARVLTAERALADLFEATAAASSPAAASKWIANDVLGALSELDTSLAESALEPAALAELIGLVEGGGLNRAGARAVLRHLVESGGAAAEAARALGLEQVNDDAQLEAWCREALAGREAVAEEVRGGNAKALGALMGPVMKASGGRANPGRARAILERLIREGP